MQMKIFSFLSVVLVALVGLFFWIQNKETVGMSSSGEGLVKGESVLPSPFLFNKLYFRRPSY